LGPRKIKESQDQANSTVGLAARTNLLHFLFPCHAGADGIVRAMATMITQTHCPSLLPSTEASWRHLKRARRLSGRESTDDARRYLLFNIVLFPFFCPCSVHSCVCHVQGCSWLSGLYL